MHLSSVKAGLSRRFPILQFLSNYGRQDAIADIVAGVTGALVLIPQSIANASLARLQPQYGLYSAVLGGLSYALLGTVGQMSVGSTSVLCLLTYQYSGENRPDIAATIALFTGILEILFGVFSLDFIIDFISMPVITGYTSAFAILVASSQLDGLVGLRFNSNGFLSTIFQFISNLHSVRLFDTVMGVVCLVSLIAMKTLKDCEVLKNNPIMFYISISLNAVVVGVASVVAYAVHEDENNPFTLTGTITGGLPSFSIPQFSFEIDGEYHSFKDVISELGFGVLTIACISIITNISVAKVFMKGKKIDASQEIIALGFANLTGAFISSLPVSGSLSRGAVVNASGVRTPLNGIYTGFLVLLALQILTPYFFFIPRAALSAVVIAAVIYMVEINTLRLIWKNNRKDLIPALGTFIVSLSIGIEVGLLFGICIDVLFILYYSSRPTFSFEKTVINYQIYWVVTPHYRLLFPAGSCIQEEILSQSISVQDAQSVVLVINLVNVPHIDFTAANIMKNVVKDAKMKYKDCILLSDNKKLVRQLEMTIPELVSVHALETYIEVFVSLDQVGNYALSGEIFFVLRIQKVI